MLSLRDVGSWLFRYRYSVAFCTAILIGMLMGGFTDREQHLPWLFGRVPILAAGGCPKTGCECIDDCLAAVYGPSGSTGSVGYPGSAAVPFEPNVGQTDSRYAFIANGAGHTVQLAATEAAFEFPASRRTRKRTIHAVVVGAQAGVQGLGQEPISGRVNYFRGNDPKKWLTDIPTFARVTFPRIYPGVDLSYHGSGGHVENDFIVSPGADPSAIRIRFDGADEVRVEADGSLTATAGDRGLSWKKPLIYQATATGRKKAVEGRFRRDSNGVIGFEVGVYDVTEPLVIDPVVTYATYFGTPQTEGAARVATDASGNAYIIGATDSPSFPVSPSGTYSLSVNGGSGDVIVAKLSASGKQMIFTTHIGGGQSNTGIGITLDASGNLYLTGLTASPDFPHTTDLTTDNILVNENCFVTKLNSAANAIIYSTLIGGSNEDGCAGIAVDSAGNAYVAGTTASTDFPTVKPVQSTLQSSPVNLYNMDAFIAKLNPTGTALLYSTYYGGANPDGATAIAVDAAGNAYVTGFTTSSNFPVTSGVFQPTYGGSGGQFDSTFATGDAFVIKMNPTGSVVYSTFLGGSKDDMGIGIAIDSKGDAYIGGATLSSNFPTLKAFQTTFGGFGGETNAVNGDIFYGGDGFVSELNPTGTALVFSSYLGGSLDDRVAGIALDASGNIWVTGDTLSTNFPVSADAPQKTNAGDNGGGQQSAQLGDAFLTEISTSGTITFSTYLGGSSADWGGGVAVDGTGGVIVAGGTASVDFPVTTGAYQTKYGGIDLQTPVGDAMIVRYGGAISSVSIAGVANAASYVGGAIAPGEALFIAGTSIGPATLAGAALDSNGSVSTLVAGTQFLFNGVAAPIVYVSATQSSVIVPYEVSTATSAQIVAVYNGVQSPPITVPVVASLPGIFSANASGTGQGAIFNQNLTYNSAQNPAAPGSIVVLFLTGEGQTSPAGVDGSVTESQITPTLPVTVSFGGVQATSYQFIGEAPGLVAGVLQINVNVPAGAPAGSSVPVTVTIGTATSQSGLTVAIQ